MYLYVLVYLSVCNVCEQVLSWFLDHDEENGLPICRLKNKFAFESDELVGLVLWCAALTTLMQLCLTSLSEKILCCLNLF